MKKISNFFFNRNQTEPQTDVLANAQGEVVTLEVIDIPIAAIVANPFQPRKIFDEAGLIELSASIREVGVIQPLIVRKVESVFELIAGERRLRASLLAGREAVPCVVRQVNDKEMAEIALIENLQREDLHYFEEATGYEKLLTLFNLTQEELATRVGKDQSTIANKLRLLKLSLTVREIIYREKLTERHSRALLKLQEEYQQLEVLHSVVENKMNVRETENFIEELGRNVEKEKVTPPRPKMLKIVKDVRIFINTVGELVKQMKKVGLDVQLKQEQNEEFVTITMVVPKHR